LIKTNSKSTIIKVNFDLPLIKNQLFHFSWLNFINRYSITKVNFAPPLQFSNCYFKVNFDQSRRLSKL